MRGNAGSYKFITRCKRIGNEGKLRKSTFFSAGISTLFVQKMALFSDPETQKTIENELEIVKKTLSEKLEGSEIISCHPVAVNIRIT